MITDSLLLAPWYWTLKLRHFLYDHGVLKSSESPVPTICVGNIAVGGTGKTPHTEMLLRLLGAQPEWKKNRIAVLSRGYGRKSKGYLEVSPEGGATLFGDEPLQIKKHFPKVTVAVCKNRIEGCLRLAEAKNSLIVLDDAFQHRALKADVNIVLTDWNRPLHKDHLLPLGRLRDLPERIQKADIVIVTKCPSYLDEWRRGLAAENIGYKGDTFFTTVSYDEPEAVFPEGDPRYTHSKWVILVTGIASDKPLARHLSDNYKLVSHMSFGDHHKFSKADIHKIAKAAEKHPAAMIATTSKDSQRILSCPDVPQSIKERLFTIPIHPEFIGEGEEEKFISALKKHLEHRSAPAQKPRG